MAKKKKKREKKKGEEEEPHLQRSAATYTRTENRARQEFQLIAYIPYMLSIPAMPIIDRLMNPVLAILAVGLSDIRYKI